MSDGKRKPADSFASVLRDLLIENGLVTGIGNPNWMEFSKLLGDVHYETLRKAVAGDRAPSAKLMEQVADYFRIEPTAFAEYRLYEFTRQFDPAEVGWEDALAALEANTKKRR
jgi:hypothetical protein